MQTNRKDFKQITARARDSLRQAYGRIGRPLPEDLSPRFAKTERKTTTPPVIVLDDSGDDDVPLSERLHRHGQGSRTGIAQHRPGGVGPRSKSTADRSHTSTSASEPRRPTPKDPAKSRSAPERQVKTKPLKQQSSSSRTTSLKGLSKQDPRLAEAIQRLHVGKPAAGVGGPGHPSAASPPGRTMEPTAKVYPSKFTAAGPFVRTTRATPVARDPNLVRPNWQAAADLFRAGFNTAAAADRGQAKQGSQAAQPKASGTSRKAPADQQEQAGAKKPRFTPKVPVNKRAQKEKPPEATSQPSPKLPTHRQKEAEPAAEEGVAEQTVEPEPATQTPDPAKQPDHQPRPPASTTTDLTADPQERCQASSEANPPATCGVVADRSSDPQRIAAEKAEWELRQAEIQKQAEEARRMKRQKREESMIMQRANARLAEHKAAQAAQEKADQEREAIRLAAKENIRRTIGTRKTPLEEMLPRVGVAVGAAPESIAKNYKRAFVFLHPDKWRNKPLKDQVWAEEVFKLISEAAEPYRVPQLQEK